jgi:periplasmic protein TonB
MTTEVEKRNQRIAAATTFVVNAVILLIMFFLGTWKMAGQGQGDYPGIEVNLGYDEQGSGDIEPETPIGSEAARDDENPPVEQPEDQTEQQPSTQPETQSTPVEQKTVEPSETLTDPNSDVEIKEKVKEEKPVEKVVEKKPDAPVEKPVEKVPVKPVEKKPIAVYPGKTTPTTETGSGDGKKGTEGNQGDDVGKEGNKGVPGGTPGAAIYKGTPGGGDGGVSFTGFKGFGKPEIKLPDLPEESYGVYEFTVKVDENGYVQEVNPKQRGLSLEAERRIRDVIQKIRFPPQGSDLPPSSEGTIKISVVSGKN